MTTGNTTSETIATACEGRNFSKGKPNPLMLVAAVVTRKRPVQPSRRFPLTSPPATTSPERIPIRLMTTWTSVNVMSPELMVSPFRLSRRPSGVVWTLPRRGPACLRRSAPLLRVLGLPAHRGADARAAARMIVEEEFLERRRLQLAILGELQRDLREAVRLGRGVEAVQVRLVFLDPDERVQRGREHEEVRAQEERRERQSGRVLDAAYLPLRVTQAQPVEKHLQQRESHHD